MDRLIIASMRKSAGKTSLIVGIAKALVNSPGYMKPFGDRLFYRKKRLWDHDSNVVAGILSLKENPEDMTIGFEHSKLRYMYDENGTREKVLEIASNTGQNKDVLFIEGGQDLTYGVSINLDAISIAKYTGAKLILVISGNEDLILDDITFLKKYIDTKDVNLQGVIVNKVHDIDEFRGTHLDRITGMGVKVLGIVPFKTELTHFSVDYLSEYLFAKVIAGEGGLNNIVKNILVGAMSTNVVLRYPPFQKENKVVITGGDRSDMILAALETNTVGIVLTGNILPPSNVVSKASERNIPLLLVPSDTYQTAKRIDCLEPLLKKDEPEKIILLGQLARECVNLKEMID